MSSVPASETNIFDLNWNRGNAVATVHSGGGTKSNHHPHHRQHQNHAERRNFVLLFGIPMLAVVGTILNYQFLKLNDLGFHDDYEENLYSGSTRTKTKTTTTKLDMTTTTTTTINTMNSTSMNSTTTATTTMMTPSMNSTMTPTTTTPTLSPTKTPPTLAPTTTTTLAPTMIPTKMAPPTMTPTITVTNTTMAPTIEMTNTTTTIITSNTTTTTNTTSTSSWCDVVAKARSTLMESLRITYDCDQLQPAAISAVVCMLTDGAPKGNATRTMSASEDYINGALALGESIRQHIDSTKTHQLLLFREGFELEEDHKIRLQSVGWVLGTAPNYHLEKKFIPKFPRYKTTYTKITAIGLSEYRCVMLMDADTLVVGDLRSIMSDCDNTVFRYPKNRVGGVLDLFSGQWKVFNTGSVLWKTSNVEMERLYNLSQDASWMKKFSSDQAFLNAVYPERRKNTTMNEQIIELDTPKSRKMSDGQISPVVLHDTAQRGQIVPLSWDYNAQTHVEVHRLSWWESHFPTVKILHYTEKKGWQCPKTLDPPPPMTNEEKANRRKTCRQDNVTALCYCREGYLFWRALADAQETVVAAKKN